MRNHNDDTIKTTSDTVLRKTYLSLYLKGLCVRGSWRRNRTATYWSPHSIGHQRCVFLVLQGFSAGRWLSLPHLVSKTRLVSKNSIGGPEGTFCWVLAFFTASCHQLQVSKLTDFLSSPSCIIVQSPTQYLPITGHRNVSLPLSLEWHVWSSSSGNNCHAVHSASVCECTVGF